MIASQETPTLEFLRLVRSGYNPYVVSEYPGDHDLKQLLEYALDAGFVERLEGNKVKSVRLTQKGAQYAEMM